MVAEKCPNCGAGIAPSAAKCEYCGTAFSDAPDLTWTRVDRHLPPPDPAHPGRSVYVITVWLPDGVSFIGKKDKKIHYFYDILQPCLISAYYDFNSKTWSNDLLGDRCRNMKDNPPTHWMSIPPKRSSAWIAAADRMPPPDTSIYWSIDILVCDQSGNFPASVIVASGEFPYNIRRWMSKGLLDGPKDEDGLQDMFVSATHWMPYPSAGPKE